MFSEEKKEDLAKLDEHRQSQRINKFKKGIAGDIGGTKREATVLSCLCPCIGKFKDDEDPDMVYQNAVAQMARDNLPHGNYDDRIFEWEAHVNEAGKTFYFNEVDKRTQWDRPKLKDGRELADDSLFDWQLEFDDSRHKYYFNGVTKESQYQLPVPNIVGEAVTHVPKPPSKPKGSKEKVDAKDTPVKRVHQPRPPSKPKK